MIVKDLIITSQSQEQIALQIFKEKPRFKSFYTTLYVENFLGDITVDGVDIKTFEQNFPYIYEKVKGWGFGDPQTEYPYCKKVLEISIADD